MKFIFRAFVASMAALATVGCQKPVATHLAGAYFAEYENDRDELELKTDATYSHVLGTSAFRQVDVGRWIIETLPNEALGISLDGFRFRDRGGQIKRPGVWHVEVPASTFSREYKLCFDPDLDRCFIKKS